MLWENDYSRIEYVIKKGTFIFDDYRILVMSEDRKKVMVLDERGNQLNEISNTESLFLMYLVKHPLYGLSIVSSVKNEDGKWVDYYLTYTDAGFVPTTESR